MRVTTKELRIQPGRILDQVVNGEEITITYRGKPMAKIIPFTGEQSNEADDNEIFGMWQNHDNQKSVEETVRDLRKGRQF